MPKSCVLRVLLIPFILLIVLSATWAGVNFIGVGVSQGQPAVSRAAEITGIENPVDDNGDVDYFLLANIRQMVGVKRGNNCAVPIVETCTSDMLEDYPDRFFYLLSMERPDPETTKFVPVEDWLTDNVFGGQRRSNPQDGFAPRAAHFLDYGSHHLWTDDELPELARWLEAVAEPMAAIEEAAKREKCYFPVVSLSENAAGLFGSRKEFVGYFKHLARAFKIRSNLHLANDDVQSWLADVNTIYRLADHVGRGNSILNQLIGFNLQSSGDEAIASAVVNGKLNKEQLEEVLKLLNSMPSTDRMPHSIQDGEKLLVLDYITKCARYGKKAIVGENGRIPINKSLILSAADYNEAIAIINDDFERVVRICELPDSEKMAAAEKFELDMKQRSAAHNHPMNSWMALLGGRKAKGRYVGTQFSDMALPVPQAFCSSVLHQRTIRKLTTLAVALQLYKTQNGSYPEKLDELVPDIVDKVDNDSFTDSPFSYRLSGEGYSLYSWGNNGKDDMGPDGSSQTSALDTRLEYTSYQSWHEFLTAAAGE